MTATRLESFGAFSMLSIRVVLPAPRKPATTITFEGDYSASVDDSISFVSVLNLLR